MEEVAQDVGAALLGFPVRVMVLDGVSELLAKGMDTCMCVAESPCYSPETITTLLIGYTPIQKKSWKKKFRPKKREEFAAKEGAISSLSGRLPKCQSVTKYRKHD